MTNLCKLGLSDLVEEEYASTYAHRGHNIRNQCILEWRITHNLEYNNS